MDKYLPCTIQMKSQRTDSCWKLWNSTLVSRPTPAAAGEVRVVPYWDHDTWHSVSTRLYCDGLWVIVAKHVFLWNWFLCISLNNFLWCWKQKVDIIDRHKLRHRGVQKLCVKWNMLSRRPSSDWMLLSHLLKVFKSEINGCVLFKFYVNCTKFKFPNEAECVMSKLPIVAPAHCTRGNITND